MINSRNFYDLDPEAQRVCQRHMDLCKADGVDILITATYRDSEQQNALYAVGRSDGDLRRRITNAKGGESWHNYRAAWDVVPLVGGKCAWDDPILWEKVIVAGIAAGAEAGARWKSFPDRPHFQHIPEGLTLIEAEDRFRTHGTIFLPES